MQPIDIHISNNVEVKLEKLSDAKRERHLAKAQNIADKILNARDAGRHAVVFKTVGYKKKLLKKILLDILPEVAFRICSLVPGILRIVL